MQNNLYTLANFQHASGCTLLFALKALSHPIMLSTRHLGFAGYSVASVTEAQLCTQEAQTTGKIFLHAYAPAWQQKDLAYILATCNSMSCNSLAQWQTVRQMQSAQEYQQCRIGLRINPCINQETIYNPAHSQSRFGEVSMTLAQAGWPACTGLHVHALAGAYVKDLSMLLDVLVSDFAPALRQADWLNLGGGHRLCDVHYNRNKAAELLRDFAVYWGLQLYLEPGEAVLRGVGGLQVTVIDVMQHTAQRQKAICIVNSSRLCHLPLLNYQQQAELACSINEGESACTIASDSCLSNDVFGHYQLERLPLHGEKILFSNTLAYHAMFASQYNGNLPPKILIV